MTNNVTKKALVIEDDAAFRRSLGEQLELHEGYVAILASSGKEAIELAKDQHFEVILLAVELADIDGRDLCRLMRRQGVRAPIIMLSDLDADADAILALDSGASDYVTKPFRLGVLLARVRAHHRQFEQFDDTTFPVGPYAFRPSTKILTNLETDRKIHLTERETAILKYLYRMGDRPARRQTLLSEVWGYKADVTTHTLETHIYRLRQKVEPDPENLQILVTEPEGYRLVR
ncbi:MAG: response regulator transcription factor [Geminicoccaceae bacterium]